MSECVITVILGCYYICLKNYFWYIYTDFVYITPTRHIRGTRWHSWFRHYATSQKLTGSIPNGVLEIFYWHNPSGLTMALGLTQPLTEMSTRNISWGLKAASACGWHNLTAFMCRLSWNLGASTSWNPQGLSRPVMGLLYLFFFFYIIRIWQGDREKDKLKNRPTLTGGKKVRNRIWSEFINIF